MTLTEMADQAGPWVMSRWRKAVFTNNAADLRALKKEFEAIGETDFGAVVAFIKSYKPKGTQDQPLSSELPIGYERLLAIEELANEPPAIYDELRVEIKKLFPNSRTVTSAELRDIVTEEFNKDPPEFTCGRCGTEGTHERQPCVCGGWIMRNS